MHLGGGQNMGEFICLDARSSYSPEGSGTLVGQLVKKAACSGFTALGLADIDTMAGLCQFSAACTAEGIKPLLGVSLTVVPGSGHKPYRVILYARDAAGYINLVRLCTAAQRPAPSGKKRISEEALFSHASGVLCIFRDVPPDYREREALFLTRFGKDFLFLAVYPQEPLFKHLRVENFPIRLVLVSGNGTVSFLEDLFLDDPELRNLELFRVAAENTQQIARLCNGRLPRVKQDLPALPLMRSFGSPDECLRAIVMKRAATLYPDPKYFTECVSGRIETELLAIGKAGKSAELLTVHWFILLARENGILTGTGCGSFSGFLVAYLLGISDIDPLKYGLLTERAMTGSGELCDPVVSVESGRHHELMELIRTSFGEDRFALAYDFFDPVPKYPRTPKGNVFILSAHALGKRIPCDTDPATGWAVSQYDDYCVRSFGAVPFTIEANPDLSRMSVMISALHEMGSIPDRFNADDIPDGDAATWQYLQDGIDPELFPDATESILISLKEIRPANITELAALLAAHESGFSEMSERLKKNGSDDRARLEYAELFGDILRETRGVFVFQEQAMLAISRLTGCSLADARKTWRSFLTRCDSRLEKIKAGLRNAAIDRGHPELSVDAFIDFLCTGSARLFLKSHYVAVARQKYRLAFLFRLWIQKKRS